MRKAIEILIGEMESKLGGYAALLNYHYLNLCVKAEPVALISISVRDNEGEQRNLEDVAFAMLADDYTYEIIPKDMRLLFAICKGLLKDHPELKQEVITPEDDKRLFRDEENEQHILCTVPKVDDNRHDLLMDAVKALYDQCKVEVDKTNVAYAAKLATKIAGFPPEEIEEAKNKLEEGQQKYAKIFDGYLSAKQKEIEDAYQHYLNEQAAKRNKADETLAARGEHAGHQMRVGDTDE